MFKYILIAALVACVSAGLEEAHAEIKSLESEVRADGFDYSLETTNNINQQASGDVHGNIHGVFGWVSPEGQHVDVKYVADEYGYQPISDALPTPPPTPIEILKSIEYIKAHPYVESNYKH